MPAELTIEGCIVVHRLDSTLRQSLGYREQSKTEDACVWIRDSPTSGNENMWHCYYADEVIQFLRELSEIQCPEEPFERQIGAIKHTSYRVHELSLNGRTDSCYGNQAFDWVIGLGSRWGSFPYSEVIRLIEHARDHIKPGQTMPICPSEAWPGNRLVEYIERWSKNKNRPPHMLLPINIIR